MIETPGPERDQPAPAPANRALRVVRDSSAPADVIPDTHPALRRAVSREGVPAESIRRLANRVGSLTALDSLDDSPVPDEPFDWAACAAEDRDFVAEVVSRVDDVCARHLDVEFRTIARRFLARVARDDPKPIRRSVAAPRIAAGVMLAVLRGNDGIGGQVGQIRAYEVARWFGVQGVGPNADTLHAAAIHELPYASDSCWGYRREPKPLCSVGLLHSRTKRSIVSQRRELIKAFLAQEKLRAGRRPMISLNVRGSQVRGCLADVSRVMIVAASSGQPMVMLELTPLAPDAEVETFALSVSEASFLFDRLSAVHEGAVTGVE